MVDVENPAIKACGLRCPEGTDLPAELRLYPPGWLAYAGP